MTKFKIEKGVSRVRRVKLQASIEESIAADLTVMGEWSNNDKNYIVNELLRFALAQDGDFQAFKQSRIGITADSQPKHPSASPASDATSSKKADATEVRSAKPGSE
jgi:hypothetical protein